MPVTTYRIDDALLAQLDAVAERRGLTRTTVVREAIAQYVAAAAEPRDRTLVELAEALAPAAGSGVPDLGSRSEEHLRALFAERAAPKKSSRGRRRPR